MIIVTYYKNGKTIGASSVREDYNNENIAKVDERIKSGLIGGGISHDTYKLSNPDQTWNDRRSDLIFN